MMALWQYLLLLPYCRNNTLHSTIRLIGGKGIFHVKGRKVVQLIESSYLK
jgi:hypothetical protein